MNRFQWNYPSEGLRHPRTMNEAFGPGARLHVDEPLITATRVLYALAGLIASMVAIVLVATK